MIPLTYKFPMRTEFVRFRARAKRANSTSFTVFYLRNTKHSRLSVVIPKKVSKLATTRNWLKRLAYDALWPLIKDQKIDCVVVFRPLPLTHIPQTKELVISELTSLSLIHNS